MSLKLIETHCHLDYLKDKPLVDIIQQSQQAGIERIITIAVEPGNLETVVELTRAHTCIYGTQGIHPHDARLAQPSTFDTIKQNATNQQKIVAIGEIGLDYHYDNSPRDTQRDVFVKQLQIAANLEMPVVIHSRDADEDTIAILEEHAPKMKKRGVIHSFTSGKALAQKALELGFYLGFNGIITFKNAQNVREIVEMTPPERILYETDSPFLTPVPFRGRQNAPFYLPYVVEKLAQLKSLPPEEMAFLGQENAKRLFDRLPS